MTRAVRVIDLITGLDMSAFHSHGGWSKMLDRLQQEVAYCAREVPGLLPSQLKAARKPEGVEQSGVGGANRAHNESGENLVLLRYDEVPMETSAEELDTTLKEDEGAGTGVGAEVGSKVVEEKVCGVGGGQGGDGSTGLMCMPERAALIKSILNFLKKAIPEPTFAENIRTRRCSLCSTV